MQAIETAQRPATDDERGKQVQPTRARFKGAASERTGGRAPGGRRTGVDVYRPTGLLSRAGIGTLQISTWPACTWNQSSRRLRRDSISSLKLGVPVSMISKSVRSDSGKSAATRIALIGTRCSDFS